MDSLRNALLQQILQELRTGLIQLYGPRLKDLVLFGSYARGQANDGSDIDVALILDDFAFASTEIERSADLVAELCLKHTCVIGMVPIREQDWLSRQDPLFLNIRREGVAIN